MVLQYEHRCKAELFTTCNTKLAKIESVEKTRSIILNKANFETKTCRDKKNIGLASEDNLPSGNQEENILAETL